MFASTAPKGEGLLFPSERGSGMIWDLRKEVGHGGRSLVDRVYGHLGDGRHRSEVVEYRADQHREQLGERVATLRAVG